MFKKNKKVIGIGLTFSLLISVFVLFGCGKIGQSNDTPKANSVSYKEFEAKSSELKTEYNIPKDVKALSVEDYQKKWPKEKFTVQSVDGTPETVYPELETLAKIGDEIEKEYPKFDEEAYVKHLAEENPTREVKEGEVTAAIQAKVEEIQAEKRYIGFVKATSEQTQEEVKTQAVAKIQALKVLRSQGTLTAQDKYYNGKLYSDEFWIIFWRPWLWGPADRAKKDATSETIKRFGKNGGGDMSDSFRHSMMNILLAKYSENDYDKAGCIWVASVLMTAHEDGASKCGDNTTYDRAMDLHNNAVARGFYDSNAWNRQVCVRIQCGWVNIRYCYDRGASKDFTFFANLAEQKARGSVKLDLKSNAGLADGSSYRNVLVRYTD